MYLVGINKIKLHFMNFNLCFLYQGYFIHTLDDLGMNVPSSLHTLRDLINCNDVDEFHRLSADRPLKIVNAVSFLKGF